MASVQRFLSGRDNLARAAALSASSVRESTAIERVAARRSGGARVRLDGAYTGHEALDVQVEIVASAGALPRASTPQFTGVGNGQLQVLAVDAGAPLQSFTLTLADLGVDTTHAGLDVRELRLVAKTAGAAGNAIRVTVAPQLARAATPWALLTDWAAGTPTKSGPEWDFGGLPLNARDELDAASPRIAFGFDPQVYRPWRQFKEGAWQFGVSPQLERDIAAGTPVYAVTGGYVVTVSDGVTTETFGDTAALPTAQPAIASFADLLAQLATSALVEVAGVVAQDRGVGGQAAIDVPLRTQAWLLALAGKVRLSDVAVPAGAPTQTLTVRCINDDVVGAERWSVAGDVSGAGPLATTGVPYASSAAAFTVPRIEPLAQGGGRWSFKFAPAERPENVGVPSVCLRPFRFGRNAQPRTLTFRYVKRPPADCKCSDMPPPRLSLKCLGLSEGDDMAMDPEYQTRLQALYEWRRDFVDSNVEFGISGLGNLGNANFGLIRSDVREVQIANGMASVMARALAEIYEVQAAREQWDVELARAIVLMAPLMGLGSSAAGPAARTATQWSPNDATLSVGDYVVPLDARNGFLYRVVWREDTTAVTYSVEPDWSAGGTIQDGGYRYVGEPYWAPTATRVLGDSMEPGNGERYIVSQAGETGAEEPFWLPGDTAVNDGTVIWTRVVSLSKEIHVAEDIKIAVYATANAPAYFALVARRGRYAAVPGWYTPEAAQVVAQAMTTAGMAGVNAIVDMVDARMDYVRTLAGIVPKSDPSSSTAGSCWVDHGDAFWWEDVDGVYLPAFTNQPYISARRDAQTGAPYSTMEFGFGLVVACPERLRQGDEITLRIEQVDAERPYRVGDEAILQTIGAGPAWLAGGVDGSDVQTWRVTGSASGLLADLMLPTDGTAAPPWSSAGVELALALGGIPFALGDAFTLAVEAGQYRWRSAGGAWSAPVDIPASGPALLADGLQLHFDAGAAPSFVAGDAYDWRVHQPWAASHVQDARATHWGWAGDGAVLTLDLGSVHSLGALALARYQLAPGATVAAEFSQDAIAWSVPLALDVSRPVCVQMMELPLQARFIRLTVANAPGGAIGWLWAGQPLATSHHASSCQRVRRWALRRSDGVNAPALYAGAGDGWRLAWERALREGDATALLALADWAQQRDEPLIFAPHHAHAHDAALVRLSADALEITDLHEYQPDDASDRLLSATLALDPVYA